MNYDDFRTLWHDTLKSAGLMTTYPPWPQDMVDLRTMDRAYSLTIYWQRSVHRADNFYQYLRQNNVR